MNNYCRDKYGTPKCLPLHLLLQLTKGLIFICGNILIPTTHIRPYRHVRSETDRQTNRQTLQFIFKIYTRRKWFEVEWMVFFAYKRSLISVT